MIQYFNRLYSIKSYYKKMGIISCAIQYILVAYLLYTGYFVYLNPIPVNCPYPFPLQSLQITNAGENVEKMEHFYIVGGNGNWCSQLHTVWKTVWSFPKKLKVELPYDPAMPLLVFSSFCL